MLIKICGLTDVSEVKFLQKNKVDFAGIVLFFEKSKRNMTIPGVRPIIDALHEAGIKAVAVTVAPTREQVKQISEAGFDFIQIHGEVGDELISESKVPVLRAFNVNDLDKYAYYMTLDNIRGFVFDAGEPGSGKTFDWNTLNGLERDSNRLYILAGGLSAENVSKAVEFVKPDGVDVSSGVEYTDRPGKDPDRIDRFVEAVRQAGV